MPVILLPFAASCSCEKKIYIYRIVRVEHCKTRKTRLMSNREERRLMERKGVPIIFNISDITIGTQEQILWSLSIPLNTCHSLNNTAMWVKVGE